MESSSIMSFNNDSALQSTLKADTNQISVHELALHAMRDRCLLLQRRINTLECDNMKLKLESTRSSDSTAPFNHLQEDEKFRLQKKIAELTKQKSQLMHHVFMVTCENKNLWNRVSNIKKGSRSDVLQPNYLNNSESPPKHTKLLRTNTYIHSTPNINEYGQDNFSESSLEEISLKLINSYIQEKSQLVEQYEQMAQLQDGDENVLNIDSIGFAYMEDPSTDSLKELRNQTEKLHQLKKELVQQEKDLKVILSKFETVIQDGHQCKSCVLRNSKQITSVHKEIETSDSLVNWVTPVESTTYNDNISEHSTTAFKNEPSQDSQDKSVLHERIDKICPMCGQYFTKECTFAEFQHHVEKHFVGDPQPDSILDNYDMVTNSVDTDVM